MSQVNSKIENEQIIIELSGRIDSTVAPVIEKEVFDILKNNETFKEVVLDFDNLEYISSAGLRVILKIKKEYSASKIINANSEVYEILEMTGFTEIIDTKKQYRKVSLDGCDKIGEGANGAVYRLDADTIIKVYKNKDALPDIKNERELARLAFVLGIPTAIPYDIVRVGEFYGSVFELLNAKSFSELIAKDPKNIDKYCKLYVDLVKKIHSTVVEKGKMKQMKETTIMWGEDLKDELPKETYTKLMKLLNDLEVRDTMLHGDYHTKNVMMQNDEVLLIDMDTLCVGHPIYEIASMYLAYIGFSEIEHDNVKNFLGLPSGEIASNFFYKAISLYIDSNDQDKINEIVNKARVVGYVRLIRRTIRRDGKNNKIGQLTIENAKKNLIELVNKIDSLDF